LQTFFISDPTVKDESKPARACDACYETVFPLIDAPSDDDTDNPNDLKTINTDTLGTLSGFPSWLSMPVLPVASNPLTVPQALMAIDLDHDREREAIASRMVVEDPKGRARLRSRPRSHHHFLEDFSYEDQDKENRQGRGRERFDLVNVPLEEGESEGGEDDGGEDEVGKMEEEMPAPSSLSSSPRKENTARRVKRFSLPAVAVQKTSVTARTGFVDVDSADVGGAKVNKRFSLVLSGGHGRGRSGGKNQHNVDGERDGDGDGRRETGPSVAASKLNELLGRRK
jgi:FYVE, RhoGEF and PH domain containing 5/6